MSARKRYHHGDLPAALRRGVVEIVGESGLDAVTIAEVARRAGVTAASPYRHYENLTALIVATGIECYLDFRESLDAAVAEASSHEPLEQLSTLYRAAFAYMKDQPAAARLVLDGRLVQWSPDYARLMRSEYERAADLVAQAVGRPVAECRTLALNCSALFLGHITLNFNGLSPVSTLEEAPGLTIEGTRQLIRDALASQGSR